MHRFIILLVTLILSIWIGVKISEDPGMAFFVYKQWTVTTPLWFAFVSVLLLFFVGYLILKLLNGIDFSLYRWRNWLKWRRKYKAYNKTNRGLIELIEGHWKNAESYLLDGIPQSDAPLLNYLAAAKAAHEQGNYDKRDVLLKHAYQVAPQAEIAIGLTQAQLQLNQGQLEQALATLTHLRSLAPKHPLVLKLLERVYVRLGDWPGLLTLLPILRKVKIIDDEEFKTFERKIYQNILKEQKNKTVTGLQAIWQSVPKHLRVDPVLVGAYAEQLLAFPEAHEEIDFLITNVMKKSWDERCVKIYGQLETQNLSKQLAKAESWLKQYPNHAMLYLTLGKLCVKNQLWGKARSNFEMSLRLEPKSETFMAFGRLLEQLNDRSGASKCYQEGLLLLTQC